MIDKQNIFRDEMFASDDLIITNAIHRDASPAGRLYEILGMQDGRRVVREIDHNIVVVGGAVTVLESLMGTTATWKPATLNDIYSVPATASGSPRLALFGAGSGGSNLDFGSVIAPDIKQRDVLTPIPMRYGETITGDDAAKYFMKVPGVGATSSWYLKEFTGSPIIKSVWKNAVNEDEDGTEITNEIYNSPNTEGIETFTEIQIDLNTKDIREYYEANGQLASARYNTFGFYTGSKNVGNTEYADVRLYSVITFNNRDLSIATASSFLYRIYSLI